MFHWPMLPAHRTTGNRVSAKQGIAEYNVRSHARRLVSAGGPAAAHRAKSHPQGIARKTFAMGMLTAPTSPNNSQIQMKPMRATPSNRFTDLTSTKGLSAGYAKRAYAGVFVQTASTTSYCMDPRRLCLFWGCLIWGSSWPASLRIMDMSIERSPAHSRARNPIKAFTNRLKSTIITG